MLFVTLCSLGTHLEEAVSHPGHAHKDDCPMDLLGGQQSGEEDLGCFLLKLVPSVHPVFPSPGGSWPIAQVTAAVARRALHTG